MPHACLCTVCRAAALCLFAVCLGVGDGWLHGTMAGGCVSAPGHRPGHSTGRWAGPCVHRDVRRFTAALDSLHAWCGSVAKCRALLAFCRGVGLAPCTADAVQPVCPCDHWRGLPCDQPHRRAVPSGCCVNICRVTIYRILRCLCTVYMGALESQRISLPVAPL